MTRRRALSRYSTGPMLALAFCAVAACANHQAELGASLTVLNAARDGFTAWDDQHQGDIVKAATSLEQGKGELDAYRKRREPVIRGFEIAYKALATAALTPEAGNLAVLATDVLELQNAVVALGAAWPGPPKETP